MDFVESLTDDEILKIKIKLDEKLIRYTLKPNEELERVILLLVDIEKEIKERRLIIV